MDVRITIDTNSKDKPKYIQKLEKKLAKQIKSLHKLGIYPQKKEGIVYDGEEDPLTVETIIYDFTVNEIQYYLNW